MGSSDRITAQIWPIADLPGLKTSDRRKLEQSGLQTTADLLALQQNPDRLRTLAARMRLREPQLQRWIAMAELAQLPGVGCQHCGLLIHAGIVSLPQLAQISPQHLHRQLMRLQVATVRSPQHCPTPAIVDSWIYRARLLTSSAGDSR